MSLLGQSVQRFDVFFLILVVFLIIGLLIAAVGLIRRKLLGSGQDATNDPMAGFSLSSLRQLVKEGKMTPQEFEATKAQIVANAQRASERKKPVDGPAPDTKIHPDDTI
ncbi:MAG: hypothetical protein KatS3mg104_2293 [Phycisphaerae bacterium]|jgi:hypothetical protein|nr:MAG: hypothetical protein KatS3mg104_2293 [Phycisphaerae bacterium]